MKRKIILLLMVFVIALSATASAKPHQGKDDDRPSYRNEKRENSSHRKQKWENSSYRSEKWHKIQHENLPFTWYEHRDRMYRPGRYVERVYDNEWNRRFPGLQAYKWRDSRGEGFWYQGRHISDAVMFYNDSDELVSVGFMHNGVFLFIREDNSGFENHDSFFLSWWN